MEKKQTAVEWLGLELNMIFHDITPELWEQVNEIFKQAKQIEKEQMKEAYLIADHYPRVYEFEKYYKETYQTK